MYDPATGTVTAWVPVASQGEETGGAEGASAAPASGGLARAVASSGNGAVVEVFWDRVKRGAGR